MNVRELQQQLTLSFRQAALESASLLTDLLLAELLGCRRLEVSTVLSRPITSPEAQQAARWASRLCQHEPIQYVLGHTEFMGIPLHCDARALIPRPETEQLVERMLDTASLWNSSTPITLADIGTGSGCIILSLAHERPGHHWHAVDASPDALSLARENAESLQLANQISWHHASLLEPFPPQSLNAIVANLPYIPTQTCTELPRNVRRHEPNSALDGGRDGLDFIRLLIEQAVIVLRPAGYIFLEISHTQGNAVCQLLQQHGFVDTQCREDYAGQDRMVEGKRP